MIIPPPFFFRASPAVNGGGDAATGPRAMGPTACASPASPAPGCPGRCGWPGSHPRLNGHDAGARPGTGVVAARRAADARAGDRGGR